MSSSQKATISRYKEQIKLLREELRAADQKIKTLEYGEESEEVFRLQEELVRKEEALLQMQATLESRRLELENLYGRMAELEKSIAQGNERQQKHLQVIDDLHIKLSRTENANLSLTEQLENLRLEHADLRRQLHASEEKVETISRMRREMEDQLSQLLQGSPLDVNKLSQDLRRREKELLELTDDLRRTQQEVSRVQDTTDLLRTRHQAELLSLQSRHRDEVHALQVKLQTMQEEVDRYRAQIQQNTASAVEPNASRVGPDQDSLRQELESRQAQISQLTAQLQESELRWRTLSEERIAQLRQERDILARERDEARREGEERLAQVRDQLAREHMAALRARDDQVEKLTAEVARLQAEFSQHREELRAQMEESLLDNRAIDDLHTQIELQRELLENIQASLQETAVERDELRREVETLRRRTDSNKDVEVKCEDLEHQLRTVLEREKHLLTNFETERTTLHQMLENTEMRLKEKEQKEQNSLQKEEEMKQYLEEGHNLTESVEEISHKYEEEKSHLEQKVIKLQMELINTKAAASLSESEFKKLKAEKEALENHVEFLNSVIVDMQQKNDDLSTRVQILETRGVFDGQLNFYNDGRKTMVFPLLSFLCDLCGDEHDTLSCPKHSGSFTPPLTECTF